MHIRKIVSVVALASITVPMAFAATDGNLGSTSQGQLDLDLQVLDSVEITSLTDIDFGQYGGGDTGGINSGDAFCVYVNGGDQYTITPTSTNGSFVLVGDTDSDEIEYTVKLIDAATGAAAASAVAYNTASASFTGSNYRDCQSINNASLDISIAEQEIRDATTDTYADTLILLVNPI